MDLDQDPAPLKIDQKDDILFKKCGSHGYIIQQYTGAGGKLMINSEILGTN